MLTENKFSKYLLYAVGEIVLVVIGILIALSINNYNNDRIANAQMITYLNSIKEDLITDKRAFSGNIDFYKNFLESKSKFLSLSQFQNISTDSLTNIILPIYADYTINTTTFNKISNLGLTELSKNDSLSKKIYTYYTYEMEYFDSVMKWEVESTEFEGNYWLYNQNVYERNPLDLKNNFAQFQDENENRQNLIELITSPKGRNFLINDYERKQRVLVAYEEMRELANELIDDIEQELTVK